MPAGLAKLVWPVAALAALLAFNAVQNSAFFDLSTGTILTVLERTAPIAIVALGMTLVIATGGVDLSVGSVVAISGSVCAVVAYPAAGPDSATGQAVIAGWGWHPALAIVAALLACTLAGMWNGKLVALFGVQPIVATLILMVAGRGIAQLVAFGQRPEADAPLFGYLGGGYLLGLPIAVHVFIVVFILTMVLTRLTALGLFVEAVGGNETASRYAGVNARLIKFLVYAFTGLCAGVAGILVMADTTVADAAKAGEFWELDAILAVVIGGTALTGGRFYLVGSVVGALIIKTLETTIQMTTIGGHSINPDYNLIVKATVVLIVCLLQSDRFRALLLGRGVR